MHTISILLFSLLTLTWTTQASANAELRALMEIKASLDPQSKVLSSWTPDSDPCSFDGVACNHHRKVANISLQGKGLSGKISPAVAGLQCLSGLYLHYNSLHGEIPQEITNLTELTELYLNVNNLSGSIPKQIGTMASLQVVQLCCNQLSGSIPTQMGSLMKLSVVALQHNQISGAIPANLANLVSLRRLDLSFNRLFGSIPIGLADLPQLQVLDVQNNSLSGTPPSGLLRLNGGFQYGNNSGLCGVGFSGLRACATWDTLNIKKPEPFGPNTTTNATRKALPKPANITSNCNQTHCPNPSKLPQIIIVAAIITSTVTISVAMFLIVLHYRRGKQKISSAFDTSDDRLSTDQNNEFFNKTNATNASPLVSLEYSNGWDPLAHDRKRSEFSHEILQSFRFNLEEIESATNYFSEAKLLGKSKFSCVYKGSLRNGSIVAIKIINITSCKSEEAEFVKGLKLLTSLKHENLIGLRGFCCSKGRGECFLVYDFVPNGNLSRCLDVKEGSCHVLDWSTRVSIINGVAKAIAYLHSEKSNKPPLVHQNISAEKILIDHHHNPFISDSGLPKLLADDIVFSTLKVSAAMGYLAPEYITTGRFTEKSDVFAFGILVLQILSGEQRLTTSMRLAAEACRFEHLVDSKLKGVFFENEAAMIVRIAVLCTRESPSERPTMEEVIQEMRK